MKQESSAERNKPTDIVKEFNASPDGLQNIKAENQWGHIEMFSKMIYQLNIIDIHDFLSKCLKAVSVKSPQNIYQVGYFLGYKLRLSCEDSCIESAFRPYQR